MQNINLYLVRRAPRGGLFSRPGLLLLAALLFGAGAGWHLLEARRITAMKTELARHDADRDRVQRQLAAVPSASAALAQQIEADERAVVALEAVVQRLGQGALARTQGFTAPLAALARTHADGVWLAGLQFDNTRGALLLDGRALDAAHLPAYLAALRAEPVFAGMAFAAIDARAISGDGPPRLEFTLRSVPAVVAAAPAAAPAAATPSPAATPAATPTLLPPAAAAPLAGTAVAAGSAHGATR